MRDNFIRNAVLYGIGGVHVGRVDGDTCYNETEKELLFHSNLLMFLVRKHFNKSIEDCYIELTEYAKIKHGVSQTANYKLTKKAKKAFKDQMLLEPTNYTYIRR